MKKIMWLFRTNLLQLEDYHQYQNLKDFEKYCWDFYLLQGIELLRQGKLDEFVVWRLRPKGNNTHDLSFSIDGKGLFYQRYVTNFEQCINHPSYQNDRRPMISFFRGGFEEYCEVTKKYKDELGLKLYLSAGKRIFPKYGGTYDKILIEDEKDINPNYKCIPFYKTANKNIFYPIKEEKKYDVCWIANFSQYRMKGQESFINFVSKSKKLGQLKILHIGNDLNRGKEYCKKYGVNNIEFIGKVRRNSINEFLNKSKIGIVTSTNEDGCPRVLSEIMLSGTPLLVRDKTRLLDYYKNIDGVFEYSDINIEEHILSAVKHSTILSENLIKDIKGKLSITTICKLNWNMWEKFDQKMRGLSHFL